MQKPSVSILPGKRDEYYPRLFSGRQGRFFPKLQYCDAGSGGSGPSLEKYQKNGFETTSSCQARCAWLVPHVLVLLMRGYPYPMALVGVATATEVTCEVYLIESP